VKQPINVDERYYLGQYNPKMLAEILYNEQFDKKLNWSNPTNLNEKINWLAFHSDTSLWTILSDKYLVRNYISSKGLEYILPNLYGVWENPETIDLDSLPESFVIKCNHDSGSAVLIKNKAVCNIDEIKQNFKKRISIPFGIISAEPHYLGIKRLVIAEELLENTLDFSDSLVDYKFWSFNGITEYCHVCYNTIDWNNKKSGIYEVNTWKLLKDKMQNHSKFPTIDIPKPICLNEMLEIIYCLTKDFPQCRVDLYESNKKVYFGELTFTSACGRIKNYSNEFLKELGDKIALPNN
jgi:hypothetical protein